MSLLDNDKLNRHPYLVRMPRDDKEWTRFIQALNDASIDVSGSPGLDESAQDAVGGILVDTASIDFSYSDVTPSISAQVLPNGVDHNQLANLTAGDSHTQYILKSGHSNQSVVGVADTSTTVVADIVAGTNDRVLRQTAGALNFGQLTAGMFPGSLTITTDFDVTGTLRLTSTNSQIRLRATAAVDPNDTIYLDKSGDIFRFMHLDNSSGTFRNILTYDFTTDASTVGEAPAYLAGFTVNSAIVNLAYSANAAFKTIARNASTGTSAYTSWNLYNDQNSGLRALEIDYSSSTYAGALVGGALAPIGEQGAIGTTGAFPLSLYTNNTVALLISNAGLITLVGGLIAGAAIRTKGYTVATLPAATQGDRAHVTDANAPVFGAAVAGGGAVMVPVYYTGAAWFVG